MATEEQDHARTATEEQDHARTATEEQDHARTAAAASAHELTPAPAGAPADEARAHRTAACYLALLALPGIGPTKAALFAAEHGGADAVLRLDEPLAAAARTHLARAGADLEAAHAAGLRVVTLEDPVFPPALALVTGCPPVLFVRGAMPTQLAAPFEALRSCAIVGTRRASGYSLALASGLARTLAENGVLVVSGLALGVDGAAHHGALAAGEDAAGRRSSGRPAATLAVLGGGHERLHPARHADLARRIVGQGGAVVSEWPPLVRPEPHQFLRRNRIISALAHTVLVVEAGARSGALNTAAHALEQGRHLVVVPGRPDDARYAGTLALLRDGCAPYVSSSDVLAGFGLVEDGTAAASGGGAGVGRGDTAVTDGRGALALDARQRRLARLVRVALLRDDEVSFDALLARVASQPGGPAGGAAGGALAAELTALLVTLELTGEVIAAGAGTYRAGERRRERPSWTGHSPSTILRHE